MDILVIVKEKGFSGLRELTEHLLENLNLRPWKITDFTSHGMFGYSGANETSLAAAVPNTEMEEYLSIFFGLSKQESRQCVESLVKLGFLRKSYENTRWSPKWVDDAAWQFLVSSNLAQ